jgi:hypothetical protein
MSNHLKRREFITFLGIGVGSALIGDQFWLDTAESRPTTVASIHFTPVQSPMPVETFPMPPERQKSLYSKFEIKDDLVLADGYTYM